MSFHEHQSPIAYRPDIDGLRALAVLPVVLFHLGLGLPGGYVGVDIFFVISGYLITSIIMKDLAKGQFSMPRFWERRIRRIVPAAVVVVFVTFVLATFLLYPSNYNDFGQSMMAQSLLFANVYFWQQHGYFAEVIGFLPLLHTWSLAIEEQFYFFFPLLLIYLYKKKSTKALTWTLAILGLSLVWSLYGVYAFPKATFYLLPSRAWELMMGSAVALYRFKKSPSRFGAEVLSWLGIALMVGSMLYYDETMPFPGAAAIPPCLGAALMIFSNHQEKSTAAKLLSLRPVVFIGKVSYSFYLWHWPLIVFMNYMYFYEPTIGMRLSVGLLSFILAVLSWRFVENPFREKVWLGERKQLFKAFYISTAALVVLGAFANLTKGAPFRFSDEVIACAKLAKERPKPKNSLKIFETGDLYRLTENPKITRKAPILLWGDSHAQAMIPLFEELCIEHNVSIYIASRPGSVPLLDVSFSSNKDLLQFNHAVFKFVEEKKIKDIILIARWSLYTKGNPWEKDSTFLYDPKNPEREPEDVFEESFAKTIAALKKRGIRIWIMKEVPMQNISVPIVMANCMRFNIDMKGLGVTLAEHEEREGFLNQQIDSVRCEQIQIIDPLPYLMGEDNVSKIGNGVIPYYRDKNHLSKFGAALLKPLFTPVFEELTADLPEKTSN